ncbi:hypothetical protein SMMN14_08826 [Sphaerulina musiva]
MFLWCSNLCLPTIWIRKLELPILRTSSNLAEENRGTVLNNWREMNTFRDEHRAWPTYKETVFGSTRQYSGLRSASLPNPKVVYEVECPAEAVYQKRQDRTRLLRQHSATHVNDLAANQNQLLRMRIAGEVKMKPNAGSVRIGKCWSPLRIHDAIDESSLTRNAPMTSRTASGWSKSIACPA